MSISYHGNFFCFLLTVEGTLCYDENTSELLYVTMVSPSIADAETLSVPQNAFTTLGSSNNSLSDVPLFSDGGQVRATCFPVLYFDIVNVRKNMPSFDAVVRPPTKETQKVVVTGP